MTSADVKFSIDDARAQSKGWGYLDAAIKSITAPDPDTVVFHLKYRWAPFVADIALFANGIIPEELRPSQSRTEFYKHPIGTGPFMWDKRVVGRSVTFKRNPNYWQKGKPYVDKVTWTYVSEDNTRELQLEGNQIQVDEFPPFNSIAKLQNTPGVTMTLFPSTRTDYLLMNENVAPLKDVHVRRAILYAIDGNAIVKSVLFGHGQVANSFLPPQVPFYDKNTPGLTYDMAKAKQELAQVGVPARLQRARCSSAPAVPETENQIAQIMQQDAQAARHQHRSAEDRGLGHASSRTSRSPQVPARLLLLDDGHRRPGRARDVRHRSQGRQRALVLQRLQQPEARRPRRTEAQHNEDPGAAPEALLADPGDRRAMTPSWRAATTRRSATPIRGRTSTASSVYPLSATTTSRTPGSSAQRIAGEEPLMGLWAYIARRASGPRADRAGRDVPDVHADPPDPG